MWGSELRLLKRNKRTIYYCLLSDVVPVADSEGYESGEQELIYAEAVAIEANVSAATGQSQIEQFGSFINYDKVIMSDDLELPIDENTVWFIDKEPEYREVVVGTEKVIDEKTGQEVDKDIIVKVPIYDYVVKRIAKSLNGLSIAISKVKVS